MLSIVAAAALAAGGAASAQVAFGSNLFGTPTYGPAIPAVVAGTQPIGPTVYLDQYGRQVYHDQYGRQVVVQQQPVERIITGYDAWGRPVYGTRQYGTYALSGVMPDTDADGVADVHDRWPADGRYR